MVRPVADTMPLSEALQVVSARFELPAEVLNLLRPASRSLRAGSAALVQGGQPTSDEFLESARKILNQMYETEQSELDIAHFDWERYGRNVRASLEANTQAQAALGSEAAAVKSEQLQAELTVASAGKQVDSLKGGLETHQDQCERSLRSFRAQLALLEQDLTTGRRVQNMTKCTTADIEAVATGDLSLLQQDPPLVLVECATAHRTELRFGGRVARLAQFHSATGRAALDAAAALARGGQLPSALPKHVQREALLQIRQPEGPEPELKCSVSGSPNCPVIADAIASMVGEIHDGVLHMQQQIAETEAACQQFTHHTEKEIESFEGERDEGSIQLSKAVSLLNENDGTSRLKKKERAELLEEMQAKQAEWEKKQLAVDQTKCGLRVVRQELYILAGKKPYIQDCEVGDWVAVGDCSQSCGGGTRQLQRKPFAQQELGANCPPLQVEEPCGEDPCPVDCEMGDWSCWSACSRDCGGGVMARSRPIEREAAYGGETCREPEETVGCNTGACDADCVTGFWGDWSACSKACDSGVRVRRKPEMEPLRGTGQCPDPDSAERMERQSCNTEECPPEVRCNSLVDVLLLLDTSGSVRPEGFAAEQALALGLLDALDVGTTTHAGVLSFAATTEVVSPLTADREALAKHLHGLSWRGTATNLGEALMTSLDVLTSGARSDALSTVVVITDGTPNSHADVAMAAGKVRQQARLMFVPTAASADLPALLSWASAPAEQNVVAPGNTTLVVDVCPNVYCAGNITDLNRTVCEGFA